MGPHTSLLTTSVMDLGLLRAVLLSLLSLLVVAPAVHAEDDDSLYTLPEGLLFGASTSNYQVEGAWNVSGKGESILDYGYHVLEKPNGDVACDSYHHVQEDINLLKKLNLTAYRFSLSWSRLLPNGSASSPNSDGVRYYNEVLDGLIEAGIEPIVTLFHFEHPLAIDKQLKGWLNETLIDKFVEYATFAFKQFGSKIRYWSTFNEPNAYCLLVYMADMIPPGGLMSSVPDGAVFKCHHYQLLAHAKAYRVYKESYYNSTQDGKIGFVMSLSPSRPFDNTSAADRAASERYNLLTIGMGAHPLTTGDYPELMKTSIAEKSYADGLNQSVLPTFTESEKKILKGAVDYFGVNMYFGVRVVDSNATLPDGVISLSDFYGSYVDVKLVSSAINSTGYYDTLYMIYNPFVMRDILLYFRDHYNNTPIFVTENGYEDCDEGLKDMRRAAYYSGYIRELTRAVHADNASVIGMTVWGFLDDFEWWTYKAKMGLVHVDFSSSNRTRTLKESASFFTQMMSERKVPYIKFESSTCVNEAYGVAESAASRSGRVLPYILVTLMCVSILK